MRVIFLDIDGVLNRYHKSENGKHQGTWDMEPELIQNLVRILEKTKAKIVITSAWRADGLDYIRDRMLANGMPSNLIENMEEAPHHPMAYRWKEIKQYLNNNEVQSYVIIDDETVLLEQHLSGSYIVKTDRLEGLTWSSVRRAVFGLTKEIIGLE